VTVYYNQEYLSMSTVPFVGVEKNVNINKSLIIGHCHYTTASVVCRSYLGCMKDTQAFGSLSTLCSGIIRSCTCSYPNVCCGVAAHLDVEIQQYKFLIFRIHILCEIWFCNNIWLIEYDVVCSMCHILCSIHFYLKTLCLVH